MKSILVLLFVSAPIFSMQQPPKVNNVKVAGIATGVSLSNGVALGSTMIAPQWSLGREVFKIGVGLAVREVMVQYQTRNQNNDK